MSAGDRYWSRHDEDGTTRTVHIPAGDPVEIEYAALAGLMEQAGFVEDALRGFVEEVAGGDPA